MRKFQPVPTFKKLKQRLEKKENVLVNDDNSSIGKWLKKTDSNSYGESKKT